jgi:hypothetical protein
MGRVTGLGGVFFKAENPEKLYEWYEKHLGIKQDVPGQGVSFRWKEDGDPEGFTAWSIFKPDTKYLEPSTKPFMLIFACKTWVDCWRSCEAKACGLTRIGRTMTTGGLLDHGTGRKPD